MTVLAACGGAAGLLIGHWTLAGAAAMLPADLPPANELRLDRTVLAFVVLMSTGCLLAFGVPPMLLGIPGDNTYSNYSEANRSFWRQTVLPLVARMGGALAGWLGPAWGGGLTLGYDADAVEALSLEREALWRRVDAADFLTPDEKREAVGYGSGSGE